jgi:DNA-binding NarL/FixJ family response regulator
VADARPVLRTALAMALGHGDLLQVVALCAPDAALTELTLRNRPDVLLLSDGLPDGSRSTVSALKTALPGMVVVVVDQETNEGSAGDDVVDVGLGPEAGFEQLVRAIHRARAGERLTLGLVRLRARGHADPTRLTPREEQVLRLLAEGASNEAIAVELHISVNTVRTHVQQVLRKLGGGRRLAAVRRAHALGLLDETG